MMRHFHCWPTKTRIQMEEKQFVLGRCGQQRISQTVYDDMDAAEEAAGAYKDIDEVMANQSDLVKIVTALSPVAVIKG